MKKGNIKTLRNKADRLIQEHFREMNLFCEGCGKPAVCMHHFFPKSIASSLRYYEANLVAVCVGCHFSHHNGDPRLHEIVRQNRQLGWYEDLLKEKRKVIKVSQGYYQKIIDKYE